MRREHLWPAGIVAVLALTIAGNVWVMRIARADPSFAIEPNYYARAVAWDSTVAQARENERLGWRLEASLAAFDERGALVRARLTDSAGAPVPDARIRVSALYVARANQVFDAVLLFNAARGEYVGPIPASPREGESWELRFVVTRRAERFTSTSRVDVPARGATTGKEGRGP